MCDFYTDINGALCVVSVCLLSDDSYDKYGMLPQPFAANYTSTPPTKTQDCLNICDEQPE